MAQNAFWKQIFFLWRMGFYRPTQPLNLENSKFFLTLPSFKNFPHFWTGPPPTTYNVLEFGKAVKWNHYQNGQEDYLLRVSQGTVKKVKPNLELRNILSVRPPQYEKD